MNVATINICAKPVFISAGQTIEPWPPFFLITEEQTGGGGGSLSLHEAFVDRVVSAWFLE